MPTDAELLRRYAADRSETAFAELVRRHLDGVYSSALRRVGFDTHLAQDIAQAVFIAFARQSRALADHPFLTAWLYATTRNEAATTVRRERRRKTREAVASAMNETNNSSSVESAADWSRLSPILDDTIDQLSEKDRAAILLRFIAQKPFAEIGAQLRLTEDAARMRVDRALNKLRTLLAKRGLTSTSATLGLLLANNAIAAAPTTVATSVTLAAIGTIPATAVVGASTAGALAAGTALTAKIYLSIAALTAVSLGYVAFTHYSATNAAVKPAPTIAVAESKITPRVWPADEASARAFFARHPAVQEALVALYYATPLTPLTARNMPLSQRHLDNPQVLAAWRENEHASLSSQYAPFYEHIRLPAEQRTAFENIIIDFTVSSFQPNLFSSVSLRDPIAAHRSLLDDACFKELRIFERNRHFYEVTINFTAHAVLAGQSLTSAESDKLAQLLTASPSLNNGWRDLRAVDWKNIEKHSADFPSSDLPRRIHQQLERAIEAALKSDREQGIPSPL